jgi:glycerol-1-phosphate dehydrogenase [NAD(P)+]
VSRQPQDANILADALPQPGNHAFADLAADLLKHDQHQALIVADENTLQACGKQVSDAVAESGLRLKKLILHGHPWVSADENSVVQALQALEGQEYLLIAVGSGTLTDIVRYVAFQTRLPFLSIPTAASVDAYTSITAAMTLGKMKHSFIMKPAEAVYAHLPTLLAAPQRLTASGFSDMLAKYTALADWKLAHVLIGETYDDAVAQQVGYALQACVQKAEAIRAANPDGLAQLFTGLAVSGICMAAVRNSRPAAGAEHSLSHFWEISHQLQQRPEALHGEKAGVASVIIARLYERLRGISRQEAAQRLNQFSAPDPQVEADRLRAILGPTAEAFLANHPSFLGKLRESTTEVKANLIQHWDRVQAIASTVPRAEEMIHLLQSAGAVSDPAQVHIQANEVDLAIENAMYVRDRLTILELNRMLGLRSLN